jgi:type II secretory pathway pseudopilin PulG
MNRSSLRMMRTPGFSLVELLVVLAIMIVVILGMLAMFDQSVKVTKTENSVTDTQQSLRYGSYQLVREVRMAGAGGVPASTSVGGVHQLGVSLNLGSTFWGAATGFASNNVNASSDTVFIAGTHHVRKGTDILHIRGIITNAVYDLGSSSWVPPTGGGTTGTLTIQPCTKFSNPTEPVSSSCYPNGSNDMSLFPVGGPFPTSRLFVMSDVLGNVGVGLITAATSVSGAKGITATVTIDVGNTTANGTYAQTLSPSGLFPAGLVSPSRGGVLDDRVYFIDDGTTTATNCNLPLGSVPGTSRAVQDQVPGPCHPVLSYADWVTGDSSVAPFSTATVTPIADDVEDLQIAYGVDFYDASSCTAGTSTSTASTCGDYPSNGSPCSLTNMASTRFHVSSGTCTSTTVPLDFASDGSISITSKTAFNTLVLSLQGTTTPNTDSTEDTTAAGHDEWVGNVTGELGTGTLDYTSDLSQLKALEISILAKGSNPDPSGRVSGTTSRPAYLGAFAWPLMDSAASTVSQPTSGLGFPYRRRASTVRVSLRNFQLQ